MENALKAFFRHKMDCLLGLVVIGLLIIEAIICRSSVFLCLISMIAIIVFIIMQRAAIKKTPSKIKSIFMKYISLYAMCSIIIFFQFVIDGIMTNKLVYTVIFMILSVIYFVTGSLASRYSK